MMDSAAAVVCRKPMGFAPPCHSSASSKELRNSVSGSVMVGRRRRPDGEILSSGFCDRGHLQYYNSARGMMSVRSGKQEMITKDKAQKKMKNKKKQLKLLKGLSRDLSTFSQMGFGLDLDGGALFDQVKGDMLSEAAELLLQRLQKLRAEEKELKRQVKEEKSRLKAAQMQNNCDMSSSCSSESSDSECGEVVDMNNLKHAQKHQNTPPPQVIVEPTSSNSISSLPNVMEAWPAAAPAPAPASVPTLLPSATTSLFPTSSEPSVSEAGPALVAMPNDLGEENVTIPVVVPACCKKIEVCMGGKCKKSGAGALLTEFQRVVGMEGAVSGCRCMGKCRDGPNVKVMNGGIADDSSVRVAANALCVGVGLEDVDMIVANFLGENHNHLGFAAAS